MKPTIHLVTIVSSLWIRCSIKKNYMRRFTLMWHPLPLFAYVRMLMDYPHLPPKCKRNNWMPCMCVCFFFLWVDWIFESISFIFTAWKVSKYGVISNSYFPVFSPNTEKYGPEITLYFDTLHSVIPLLHF